MWDSFGLVSNKLSTFWELVLTKSNYGNSDSTNKWLKNADSIIIKIYSKMLWFPKACL